MKRPRLTKELIEAIPAVSDAIDNLVEGLIDNEDTPDYDPSVLLGLALFDGYLTAMKEWDNEKKNRRKK